MTGIKFINQTILAKQLGITPVEAGKKLELIGLRDVKTKQATNDAILKGLANIVETPVLGKVSMWSPDVVDMIDGMQNLDSEFTGDKISIQPNDVLNENMSRSEKNSPHTIFIASSIEEFKSERTQIVGILHAINRNFDAFLAEFHEDGDNQNAINQHIASSEHFVAVVGRKLGRKTIGEIEFAMQLNRKHGYPKIKIFLQEFGDNNQERSPEVEVFARKLYDEGEYYPRTFADSSELIDQVELFFRRMGSRKHS
jgi:hypothetical protein